MLEIAELEVDRLRRILKSLYFYNQAPKKLNRENKIKIFLIK